jgi:hypothetical protein
VKPGGCATSCSIVLELPRVPLEGCNPPDLLPCEVNAGIKFRPGFTSIHLNSIHYCEWLTLQHHVVGEHGKADMASPSSHHDVSLVRIHEQAAVEVRVVRDDNPSAARYKSPCARGRQGSQDGHQKETNPSGHSHLLHNIIHHLYHNVNSTVNMLKTAYFTAFIVLLFNETKHG